MTKPPATQTLGITLMIATTFVFALQDGVTRTLAYNLPIPVIVMVRYWFFAIFALVVSTQTSGGLVAAARSSTPWTQITRGVILAIEMTVMGLAFHALGLVGTHAIFACYPLIVAALSIPLLKERVGWRRWVAIGVGFLGVLIILQPGSGLWSPYATLSLASAMLFAIYSVLTRLVSRYDSPQTSFLWTAVTGAIVMTVLGGLTWQPVPPEAQGWLSVLCVLGVLAHYLLIKAYSLAEASAVQPFAYFQLPFTSLLGVVVFAEPIPAHVVIGATIVVLAGLFTLRRARQQA